MVRFLVPAPASRFCAAMASARFQLPWKPFPPTLHAFFVRNTSQTRNFEIFLRPPRRFAHERVDERVRETAPGAGSACRGKATGRQRPALAELRIVVSVARDGRWQLCTPLAGSAGGEGGWGGGEGVENFRGGAQNSDWDAACGGADTGS